MAHETENTDPQERPPGPVEDLRRRLSLRQSLDRLKRSDAVLRLQARVAHRIAVAGARAEARRDRRTRREEERDATESSTLVDLYRRATVSGERARVRSQIQQSAEMRAMRIEKVRRTSLLVLIPVLIAFAAWSTAGVHFGFTTILSVESGSAMWWTAWGIEPALITIVAGIIVVRAVLRSSGGDLDWRATVAEWGALSASVALNMAGHWPEATTWSAVASVVAHSIGPIGAALTAWLAGVIDDAVSHATPEKGAPSLSDMGLSRRLPGPVASGRTLEGEGVAAMSEPDTAAVDAPVAPPVAPTTPAPELPVASDTAQVSAPVVSMSDRSDRDQKVIGWLMDDPDMSGAEIGRRVSATAKTGQRLKNRLAPVAARLGEGDIGQEAVASEG